MALTEDGARKREEGGRFPQPPPSTAGYRMSPTLVEEPLVSLFTRLLLLVEISTEVSFVSLDSRPPPFLDSPIMRLNPNRIQTSSEIKVHLEPNLPPPFEVLFCAGTKNHYLSPDTYPQLI